MRMALAVTLILCGTLLVALPPLFDYLVTQAEARLLERPGATSVSLRGRMGDEYSFCCFALGTAMIGTAIFSAKGPARGDAGDRMVA